jgi:membrane protease YdiL (CAAX protease family)
MFLVFLLGAAILLWFFVVFPAAWFLAGLWWVTTGQLLPWVRRRHVPWGLVDVIVIVAPILLLFVGPAIFMAPREAAEPLAVKPAAHLTAILLDAAVKLVIATLAISYLMLKCQATLRDLGWSASKAGRNALIGVIAFIMVAPPVHLLQVLLVWGLKWQYEHPLVDMLQKTPDPLLFAAMTFSACVVAPLSEEFLFRVLLQGWLQRLSAWLAENAASRPAGPLSADAPQPVAWMSAGDAAGFCNEPPISTSFAGPFPLSLPHEPYVTPSAIHSPPTVTCALADEDVPQPYPRNLIIHGLPILASALLFALAHIGHGPAPITLIPLAIALGFVYQRTHSIVPVVVIHGLFNGFSMLMFFVSLFVLKQPLP